MIFSSFTYKFESYKAYNTYIIYCTYSSLVCEYIKISLKYIIIKISKYFFSTLLINAWKVAGALINPKDITKYSKCL